MAKKRMSAKQRRYFGKKSRSRRSGSSGGSFSNEMMLTGGISAAAYGAFRNDIEQAIAPVSSKLPFGDYNDEALLGTAAFFVAKGKIPMLKDKKVRTAAYSVFIVESARVGAGVRAGMTGSG